ncbi:MAG TPA: hypothetical protein VGI61_10240 [Parafilimonas sp.]
MKKLLLVLIIIIIVAIALVYALIPSTIVVSKIVYTNTKSASVLRCLHDDAKWHQWFPKNTNSANVLLYNNQQYKPGRNEYSSIEVALQNNQTTYESIINVLPLNIDSSAIQWQLQLQAGNNPFKRFEQYQTAKKIKNNMADLLDSFKIFIADTKNIYGFPINYTTLSDTALVSIKTIAKQYPSTEIIYSMVDELRKYIAQQHANEHNYPMLNITKQQDSNYEVMVGIPTDIPLPGNNHIEPKRMIMIKNKTLITEVTGDTSAIRKAFQATGNFMKDYELKPPVIPFQQLVTDRRKEKDSTKWITRIFTPII